MASSGVSGRRRTFRRSPRCRESGRTDRAAPARARLDTDRRSRDGIAQPAMPSSTKAATHLVICALIGSTTGCPCQLLQPVRQRCAVGQGNRSSRCGGADAAARGAPQGRLHALVPQLAEIGCLGRGRWLGVFPASSVRGCVAWTLRKIVLKARPARRRRRASTCSSIGSSGSKPNSRWPRHTSAASIWRSPAPHAGAARLRRAPPLASARATLLGRIRPARWTAAGIRDWTGSRSRPAGVRASRTARIEGQVLQPMNRVVVHEPLHGPELGHRLARLVDRGCGCGRSPAGQGPWARTGRDSLAILLKAPLRP